MLSFFRLFTGYWPDRIQSRRRWRLLRATKHLDGPTCRGKSFNSSKLTVMFYDLNQPIWQGIAQRLAPRITVGRPKQSLSTHKSLRRKLPPILPYRVESCSTDDGDKTRKSKKQCVYYRARQELCMCSTPFSTFLADTARLRCKNA